MIEEWILGKIDSHRDAPLLILRDPQRMIQPGAQAVDGWAEANGFTVLLCTGNLALREMYEAMRDDRESRLLLVDRSRAQAATPLFYPDVEAHCPPNRRLALSLQAFLVEQTGDPTWPLLVEERNLARLILDNLAGTLTAHSRLRARRPSGFSDSDLYRVVLGGALGIDPFRTLDPTTLRRVCMEHHQTLDELQSILPEGVMQQWRQEVARAPKPFCWLLERDAQAIVRAFTLAAILHQHGLDYRLLLSNLDPALHEFREIDPGFLQEAMQEQIRGDQERVAADVADAEKFLGGESGRLRFLLLQQLSIETPKGALRLLEHERLSPLLRSLALFSLLADLLIHRRLTFHDRVAKLLDAQNQRTDIPALRRPGLEWSEMVGVYRRALKTLHLTARAAEYAKRLQVMPVAELDFADFDNLWNQDGLNRLDYYISDLRRVLRLGALLPLPTHKLWPEMTARWEQARQEMEEIAASVEKVQNLFNARFQDLYAAHYLAWIRQPDSPVIFSHQFIERMLAVYWDPQSGQKAVVMIFDGLRADAWEELLRPVFEERYRIIARHPGSALLPSETQLSRKALAAGCLPEAFTSRNERELLSRAVQRRFGFDPKLETVKDDDTVASGMTVRFVSEKLEYIIFNFTDDNLHHNSQDLAFIYNTTVREIIRQDVRSVLRELPADALLFVASDHGFAPVADRALTVAAALVADQADIKYRNARLSKQLPSQEAAHFVTFDARRMGIPTQSEGNSAVSLHSVVFPRPGWTLKRPKGPHNPDRYSHGGLSLAECLTPLVVLGPPQAGQPLLGIERFVQVGSVGEGESLGLALTLTPLRIGGEERTITLTFSRDEIGERRELFGGRETTYSIAWTPTGLDPSPEERQAGEVRLPVTCLVSYQEGGRSVRLSRTVEARIKLDPSKVRRRVDSKLDLLMGKVPKGLQS